MTSTSAKTGGGRNSRDPQSACNRGQAGPAAKLGILPKSNSKVLPAVKNHPSRKERPGDKCIQRDLPDNSSASPRQHGSGRDRHGQREEWPRNSSRRHNSHPQAGEQEHHQSPKDHECAWAHCCRNAPDQARRASVVPLAIVQQNWTCAGPADLSRSSYDLQLPWRPPHQIESPEQGGNPNHHEAGEPQNTLAVRHMGEPQAIGF